MYIIVNDDEKKVLGICKDRNKAIIVRNYFEHVMSDCIGEDSILILEANEKDVMDNEEEPSSNGEWTDIALENQPLDFKLNVLTDLKPNNWIYDEFDRKKKKDEFLKAQRKDRIDRDAHIFEQSFLQVRDKYLPDMQNMYNDIVSFESDTKKIHKDVVEGRKKVKKKMMPESEFDELCAREKDMKNELGKKKRKYTTHVTKASNELVNMMAKHNMICFMNRYEYDQQTNKVHVFTAKIYGVGCHSIYLDS